MIAHAAGERASSIVMTLLATFLVFLPFAVAGGAAGLEIFQALAFGIFGGLITTAFLVLFVVPALYARYGASSEPALDLEGVTE